MRYFTWALLLCGTLIYFQDLRADRPPIDPKQKIEIIYGDRDYNLNKDKVDAVTIIIKEGDTGRIRPVTLIETENNSSVFLSLIEFHEWADLAEVYPEVFVPATLLANDTDALNAFIKSVQAKQRERQPTVLKKHDSGLQFLQVYKTRNDMMTDLKKQKKELDLEIANLQFERKLRQKYPEQDLIDLATRSEKITYLANLQKQEVERQNRRARKEQEKRKEFLALKKTYSDLDEEAAKKALTSSKKLISSAEKQFTSQDFTNALASYNNAFVKHPVDQEILFKIGLTQMRLEQFDDAIVSFNILDVPTPLRFERDYYLALAHYKLEELTASLIQFRALIASQHPSTLPSALFYEGLILYSQEKFIEAQASFEEVIRRSEDSALDEKAEKYLDDIAWKVRFKKNRIQRWFIGFELQEIYDSNILFATDNQEEQGLSGLPGKRDGFRSHLLGDLGHRVVYNESHELSIKASSAYMYSHDSTFKRADPFIVSGSTPYTYKGVLGGKTFQAILTPSHEVLYMDASDEGQRENIQDKSQIDVDLIYGVRKNWISTYSLVYGVADSHLDILTERDDADAETYGVQTQQNIYLKENKKSALIPRLGYNINAADGENKDYERIDVGLTYVNSQWLDATWYLNLNFYTLEFANHDQTRRDKNTSTRFGVKKSFHPLWACGLDLSHAINKSNVVANDYTKTTALLSLSFQWSK